MKYAITRHTSMLNLSDCIDFENGGFRMNICHLKGVCNIKISNSFEVL